MSSEEVATAAIAAAQAAAIADQGASDTPVHSSSTKTTTTPSSPATLSTNNTNSAKENYATLHERLLEYSRSFLARSIVASGRFYVGRVPSRGSFQTWLSARSQTTEKRIDTPTFVVFRLFSTFHIISLSLSPSRFLAFCLTFCFPALSCYDLFFLFCGGCWVERQNAWQ